jgi:hypothetical protein
MRFIVLKDYEPHDFKKDDVVLINEIAWPDFIKELTEQEFIKELGD